MWSQNWSVADPAVIVGCAETPKVASMDSFTPLPALLGGGLIGLASALLWLGNGRIAGISGIFGRLLPPAQTVIWRLLFLVAMVAGAWLASRAFPSLGVGGPAGRAAGLVTAPAWTGIPTSVWLVVAGLLTGVGTKIGNGCTSGHGVCGLARLSRRSMVAVAIFFGVAIVTVALTRIV
jgi:uncharacterized membrane protein YedE/YeeE